MPKYVFIDDEGNLEEEVFDTKAEAEQWLQDAVANGDVKSSDAEGYSAYELDPRNIEIETVVKVTIS